MDSAAPWIARKLTCKRLARQVVLPDFFGLLRCVRAHAGAIDPAAACHPGRAAGAHFSFRHPTNRNRSGSMKQPVDLEESLGDDFFMMEALATAIARARRVG
jgi:hypothetical protein